MANSKQEELQRLQKNKQKINVTTQQNQVQKLVSTNTKKVGEQPGQQEKQKIIDSGLPSAKIS